jgi:hypothetical protein
LDLYEVHGLPLGEEALVYLGQLNPRETLEVEAFFGF